MENTLENKLDLYEQHVLTHHKIALICSFIGLAWAIIVLCGPSNLKNYLGLGALLIAVPQIVTPIKFSGEYKSVRNKITLIMFASMILLCGICIGLVALFPRVPGYILGIGAFVNFVSLWLWVQKLRNGIKEKAEEERLTMIANKSERISNNVFIFQFVLAFMILALFNFQMPKEKYFALFFTAMFVSLLSMSLSFFYYYRKN